MSLKRVHRYQKRMRAVALVVVLMCAAASSARAQYFRNAGVRGHVGWLGLGSSMDGLFGKKLWNATDQVTFGATGFYSIGYDTWYEATAVLGFGGVRIASPGVPNPIVVSLQVDLAGFRYMFLEERFRPYVAAGLPVMSLFGNAAAGDVPANTFLGSVPIWIGARVGGGIEYIFVDEMSLNLDVGLTGFFGLGNTPPVNGVFSPVMPATQAKLGFNIYF
jgi:hypothetical protein